MTRPEEKPLPPNLFYDKSTNYASLSRMNVVQTEITDRCLDFLDLEETALILDLGCGTGMSGRELARNGHNWVGCDISRDMLINGREGMHDSDDEYSGNPLALLNLDISECIPFKTGVFDAFVSVSCFQWLFHNRNVPESRKIVKKLFTRLRDIIKYKGKGVVQFYSQHNEHTQVLIDEATRCGFITEFRNDGDGKKRKQYLLLDCTVKEKTARKPKKIDKVRERITKMKERRIKKGLSVSRDSKYSGRKRCKKFL